MATPPFLVYTVERTVFLSRLSGSVSSGDNLCRRKRRGGIPGRTPPPARSANTSGARHHDGGRLCFMFMSFAHIDLLSSCSSSWRTRPQPNSAGAYPYLSSGAPRGSLGTVSRRLAHASTPVSGLSFRNYPPTNDQQQQCRCWSWPTELDLLISDRLRRANLLS